LCALSPHLPWRAAPGSCPSFHHQAHDSLINIIALSLLQLIIVIGALLVVFNGLLLRPLDALSNALAAAAKNEETEDLGELAKRADEIGDMARAVDAIKSALAKKKKAGR
jgi:methyl-accepting chemotaxis protein